MFKYIFVSAGPCATAAAKSPQHCFSFSHSSSECATYSWSLAAKVRNKIIHATHGNGGGGARTTSRKRSEREQSIGGPSLNEDTLSQILQLLNLLQSLLSHFGKLKQDNSNGLSIAGLLSSFAQGRVFDSKPKPKKPKAKRKKPKHVIAPPSFAKQSDPNVARIPKEKESTGKKSTLQQKPAKKPSQPTSAPRTFAEVAKAATGDFAFQPVWQLRAADWDGEILTFDEIAERMGADEKPIRVVTLMSSECELDELKALIQSEAKPDRKIGVTVVMASTKGDVPKPDGEITQVPGKVRGKLVPRLSHVLTLGVECPKLKKQVRTVATAPSVSQTVVLRLSTEAKYHQDQHWRSIVDNAGGAAHKWIHANVPAAMQRQIRGIWKWQLQSSKGGGKALITALMRVELSAAKTLLSLSGQGAWFIEPLRWDQPDIPSCQVRWVKRLHDEPGHVYATRVLSMVGNLGLAKGLKSLGVRVPQSTDKKSATRIKTWKVTGVPRSWGHESLIPELEAAGLSNLQLTSRKPHGRTTCLFFTAECTQEIDFIELVFGSTTVTASAFNPMKSMRSEIQQLNTVSTLSFSPATHNVVGSAEVKPASRTSFYAASPVRVVPKATATLLPDAASATAPAKETSFASAPATVEASQQAAPGDADMGSPSNTATKRTVGTPGKDVKPPQAKKRAIVRDVPKGLVRVPNSGQGNCLFEAIAQGLSQDKPKPERSIRASDTCTFQCRNNTTAAHA